MSVLTAPVVHQQRRPSQRELERELVRADVLPLADTCPVAAAASNTSDFFPPCLHLARLLVTVLPPGDLTAWRQGLPSELDLPPLESISGAHPAGLNFSRAWGLGSLYETTGDLRFRDSYIDHIETHVAMPEYWADDYFYYSHWVAQFGVYALALGYEPGEVP